MSVKTTIVASRASYVSVDSVAQCLLWYIMFNIKLTNICFIYVLI